MKKKVVSLMIIFAMVMTFMPTNIIGSNVNAASFNDINQPSVFLNQPSADGTCTLVAATMMVRRTAILQGNSNWQSITPSSMRSVAWAPGLYYTFTYAGITVKHANLPGGANNKNFLISLLAQHPEGIEIYDRNTPHAVLLTDYTNGVFYCADPSYSNPAARMPISNAYKVTIENADEYWYVASPKCYLDGNKPAELDPDNYKVPYSRPLYVRDGWAVNDRMHGDDVLYMQVCLKYLGYTLDTDGWYGPGTAAVVKNFQSSHGLTADGDCGQATWPAIEAAVAAKKKPVKIPGKPTISVIPGSDTRDTVFSWNATSDTEHYDIRIYNSDGTQNYIKVGIKDTSFSIKLPAGKYYCNVASCNNTYLTSTTSDNSSIFTVEKTCTITYDANGGSGAPANQTVNHNQASKLSSAKPTRRGYDFKGWSTSKTATSATYAAGDSLTTKTDVTLYAVWSKATLSSIWIKREPSKTTYTVGDTLDTTDLIVVGTYSDDSSSIVRSGYTCSPTSLTKAGKQTITVSYGGKTTSFTVTVNEKASNTKTPTITVGNVTGAPGSTVNVPITLSNNPGIVSATMKVNFDTTRLELVSVEYNSAIGGSTVNPVDNKNFSGSKSPVTLIWNNGTANYSGNGQFAVLQFKVLNNAKQGKASITISHTEIDKIENRNEKEVVFEAVNGYVNVSSYIPGDINNDGRVNNRDVTRLLQFLAGWDVEINDAAKDVNGDGRVNNRDVTRLLQFLAGWDVEIH